MKKMSNRILRAVLPIMIISLVIVEVISCFLAMDSIKKQIRNQMLKTIEASSNMMQADMKDYEVQTESVANAIGKLIGTYDNLDHYDNILKDVIEKNDMIIAMGYFLEPGVYQDKQRAYSYLGLENGKAQKTDLGEFKYLESDWYKTVKETGKYYYVDPYVDNTYNAMMVSYIEPIFDSQGKFLGAINTDVDLTAIQDIVNNIKAGNTGKAMLINYDGTYLSCDDSEKVLNVKFNEDKKSGFTKKTAETILNNKQGDLVITKNGKKYITYYEKIDKYNWTLLIEVDKREVLNSLYALIKTALIVMAATIVVCCIVITLVTKKMTKSIVAVRDHSKKMSEGDFSIEPLKITSKDEIGHMTEALNEMLTMNRNEMLSIKENSNTVDENCEVLHKAVQELNSGFMEISHAIETISGAMMDNSATTEELTASVSEVNHAVTELAGKAKDSQQLSEEIMQRAQKIEKESSESFDHAMNLGKQYEKRLKISIDNSTVVNEIGTMADAISEIASQINLLSLNASIEAARAGEHGRGFAVVAEEIGNLATQTSETVTSIQNTISKVRESVDTLVKDSKELITFISDEVTPDYQYFVDTSKKYEDDANSVQSLSGYLADMAMQLKTTMGEVNMAIQNIAEASQDAAEQSSVILSNVDGVSEQVTNLGDITEQQRQIALTLDNVVNRYKL